MGLAVAVGAPWGTPVTASGVPSVAVLGSGGPTGALGVLETAEMDAAWAWGESTCGGSFSTLSGPS